MLVGKISCRYELTLKPLNDPTQDQNEGQQHDDDQPEIGKQSIRSFDQVFKKHGVDHPINAGHTWLDDQTYLDAASRKLFCTLDRNAGGAST